MNVTIKAVVTKPDGSLFYREEHEWNGVDLDMAAWFTKKGDHLSKFAKDNVNKNEDGANLTCVLTGSIGIVPMPTLTFTGVSYHELVKFEREFHRMSDELIKIGEGKAQHKK